MSNDYPFTSLTFISEQYICSFEILYFVFKRIFRNWDSKKACMADCYKSELYLVNKFVFQRLISNLGCIFILMSVLKRF